MSELVEKDAMMPSKFGGSSAIAYPNYDTLYIGTVHSHEVRELGGGNYQLVLRNEYGSGRPDHIDITPDTITWSNRRLKGADNFTLGRDGSMTYHGVNWGEAYDESDRPTTEEWTEKFDERETTPFFDMVYNAMAALKTVESVDLVITNEYDNEIRGAYYTNLPGLFKTFLNSQQLNKW